MSLNGGRKCILLEGCFRCRGDDLRCEIKMFGAVEHFNLKVEQF